MHSIIRYKFLQLILIIKITYYNNVHVVVVVVVIVLCDYQLMTDMNNIKFNTTWWKQ